MQGLFQVEEWEVAISHKGEDKLLKHWVCLQYAVYSLHFWAATIRLPGVNWKTS